MYSATALRILVIASMIFSVRGFSESGSSETTDPEVIKLDLHADQLRAGGKSNAAAMDAKLASIKGESLEESLRLLPLDGLSFYLPSLMAVDLSTPMALPLFERVYQRDLTRILFNPRFQKLLAEVRSEDRALVSPRLLGAIEESKSLFDRLYAKTMTSRPNLFSEDSLQASAALGAEDWSDGTTDPTLAGVRLGVLSLLLLAADLRLTEAADLVANIAIECQDRRAYFYREESGNLRARVYAVAGGLYHPQILATVIHGVMPVETSQPNPKASVEPDFKEVQLASVDYSGATIQSSAGVEAKLRILGACNDNELDQSISELTRQLD